MLMSHSKGEQTKEKEKVPPESFIHASPMQNDDVAVL